MAFRFCPKALFLPTGDMDRYCVTGWYCARVGARGEEPLGMKDPIRIAMLCLSQTESDGGNHEKVYSATFFPLAVDVGEPQIHDEVTIAFWTHKPELITGETYFFTIERG